MKKLSCLLVLLVIATGCNAAHMAGAGIDGFRRGYANEPDYYSRDSRRLDAIQQQLRDMQYQQQMDESNRAFQRILDDINRGR